MTDWLDDQLSRLPSEPPDPELAVRICAAVAQRRRRQRVELYARGGALLCGGLGVGLVGLTGSSFFTAWLAALLAMGDWLAAASPLAWLSTLLQGGAAWSGPLAQAMSPGLGVGLGLLGVAIWIELQHQLRQVRGLLMTGPGL